MNKPLALETENLCPYGPGWRTRGEHVYRGSARQMNDGCGNGDSRFTGALTREPGGTELQWGA